MTSDPLDQITLTPRGFGAALAFLAVVIGLVLALVPVGVAHPDPASSHGVTCGNAIGGAETDWIVDDLGYDVQATTVAYIALCEEATTSRATKAWLLFAAGLVGLFALGALRAPRPASPGSAPPSGPAPA